MSKKIIEKANELFKDKQDVIPKANNPLMLAKGVKVFRRLCRKCKKKLSQKVRTEETDFCDKCLDVIERYLG